MTTTATWATMTAGQISGPEDLGERGPSRGRELVQGVAMKHAKRRIVRRVLDEPGQSLDGIPGFDARRVP